MPAIRKLGLSRDGHVQAVYHAEGFCQVCGGVPGDGGGKRLGSSIRPRVVGKGASARAAQGGAAPGCP